MAARHRRRRRGAGAIAVAFATTATLALTLLLMLPPQTHAQSSLAYAAQQQQPSSSPAGGRCTPGSSRGLPAGTQCCGNGFIGVACGGPGGECAVCCQVGTYQCIAGQCVANAGLCNVPGLGLFACAPGYQCNGQQGGCVLSNTAAAGAAAAPSQVTGLCPVTGQPPCGGICCASSAVCIASQCVPRVSTIPSPGTPGGSAYCAPGYLAGYSSTGAPACVASAFACGAAPGGAPPQCCGAVANVCLNNQAGPCCTPENTCGGVNGQPQFCCPGGCIASQGACCPTALCNGVCCPTGTACIGGTCCAPGNQCGDSCCPPGVGCASGVCCASPNVPCGSSACCPPGSACLQSGTCCSGTPCGTSGCCTGAQQCVNGGCSTPAPPPPPVVVSTGFVGGPVYGGFGGGVWGNGCFPPCSWGLTCAWGRCVRIGGVGLDG